MASASADRRVLLALFFERVEYSSKSLSFIGIWIGFVQPCHHSYVVRANLLCEAVSLGAESFERLADRTGMYWDSRRTCPVLRPKGR